MPTGPCWTSGMVAGAVAVDEDAEEEDVAVRGIVRIIDVVVGPPSGFTVITSTIVCPN